MNLCRVSLFCRAFPILNALRPELSWTHDSNSERTAYQITAKSKQVLPREKELFYQAFPNCDALRHELSWPLVLPSEEELRTELMREQRLLAGEQESGNGRRGIPKA